MKLRYIVILFFMMFLGLRIVSADRLDQLTRSKPTSEIISSTLDNPRLDGIQWPSYSLDEDGTPGSYVLGDCAKDEGIPTIKSKKVTSNGCSVWLSPYEKSWK